ncbi:MAG: Asp-tRNA(Asn)/Glu-tRNA(Gln) amidotransferase subunit GatC [Panacagrimonas sp.]
MSLTPEQVQQVAHLARLALKPEQLEPYAGQLSRIMQMIDALAQAPTEGVEPMAHPLKMVQRLRPDGVTAHESRDALQASAPAVKDGLFTVPKVIE